MVIYLRIGPTLDELLPLLDEGGYHYHIWGGGWEKMEVRVMMTMVVMVMVTQVPLAMTALVMTS